MTSLSLKTSGDFRAIDLRPLRSDVDGCQVLMTLAIKVNRGLMVEPRQNCERLTAHGLHHADVAVCTLARADVAGQSPRYFGEKRDGPQDIPSKHAAMQKHASVTVAVAAKKWAKELLRDVGHGHCEALALAYSEGNKAVIDLVAPDAKRGFIAVPLQALRRESYELPESVQVLTVSNGELNNNLFAPLFKASIRSDKADPVGRFLRPVVERVVFAANEAEVGSSRKPVLRVTEMNAVRGAVSSKPQLHSLLAQRDVRSARECFEQGGSGGTLVDGPKFVSVIRIPSTLDRLNHTPILRLQEAA